MFNDLARNFSTWWGFPVNSALQPFLDICPTRFRGSLKIKVYADYSPFLKFWNSTFLKHPIFYNYETNLSSFSFFIKKRGEKICAQRSGKRPLLIIIHEKICYKRLFYYLSNFCNTYFIIISWEILQAYILEKNLAINAFKDNKVNDLTFEFPMLKEFDCYCF